jgi:DnaJ like chaperone protein
LRSVIVKKDYKGKLIGGGLGWLAGGPVGIAVGAVLGHVYDSVDVGTKIEYYNVLGLNRTATREEIKRRYLELSTKYHPDKVSHLGKELIDLAHRKFTDINAAYEKIQKERGF